MGSPPNYPVIVVHTDDGNGLTAFAGQPIRLFGQYRTPNMSGPAGDVSGGAENKVSAETQRDLYACPLSCECEGGEE